MSLPIINKRAPGVPFYTPLQSPPAGTARAEPKTLLFTLLKIRGVEFPNRVWVSPMQQYSADNGKMTPWHMAYLGGILTRGPGLTFVEGSAVEAIGRITPEDLGLWDDSQIESHQEVVRFAHSQGKKIGIQLMHSGRKGSCVALWLSFSAVATPAAGGWADKIVAPSAVPFEQGYPVPHALTIKEIEEIVVAFKNSAQRAVTVGYDVINIHAAHGYLLSEFLSPVANKRTDNYGGSFENRIRIVLEIIDAVRAVIPETMPLVLRSVSLDLTDIFLLMHPYCSVSATDCLEKENYPSWKLPDTIELAKIIRNHGVDVLDVSSGGQSAAQTINVFDIQSVYAKQIKDVVGDSLLVGCLGGITSGKVAESYLQEKRGDMCFVGRNFLEKPGTAWEFAEELEESVHMSKQLEWPFIGRGKRA
ncbi:FMN-linked oxidoreductase [Lentinula aciculospora]|uniref:FMN-linked oxidoreductase n=1 Tax=Lentinula aciculospora TaxID=153920 RepID=A0A9W9AQM6_9AGAR|nr:FMN-linked oxidoreductase [Lentinula aciculospora]